MLLPTLLALVLFFTEVPFLYAQDCAPASPGPRSLLKQGEVIFAGTLEDENVDAYQFRVTEAFKGTTTAHDFDLLHVGPPLSKSLEKGEQYLVFAGSLSLNDGRHYYVPGCGLTEKLRYAQAVVKQLRAEKSGKRVASVYGMLRQTTDYISSYWDERFDRPLPGIVVKLKSNERVFQTKTDDDGVFAFEDLPQGTYEPLAELPAGLTLAGEYFEDPPPAFQLPGRSSFDYELTALPTGRIRGRVVGPDGEPLRDTSVEIYRPDSFSLDKNGALASQIDGKSFEFPYLPQGDYILVFNRRNNASPDDPFARTFYPDATDVQGAQVIRVAGGQQISGANIHVSHPMPTRQITVTIRWGSLAPAKYQHPVVIVESSVGRNPYPFKIGTDTFSLNLFETARYTIHGQTFCQNGRKGEVATDYATIDGQDFSTTAVTLTFAGSDCSPK
jgi:hypothetical protein